MGRQILSGREQERERGAFDRTRTGVVDKGYMEERPGAIRAGSRPSLSPRKSAVSADLLYGLTLDPKIGEYRTSTSHERDSPSRYADSRVEQSLTSESLLLYLGQRTPKWTPGGVVISKSMQMLPGNEVLQMPQSPLATLLAATQTPSSSIIESSNIFPESKFQSANGGSRYSVVQSLQTGNRTLRQANSLLSTPTHTGTADSVRRGVSPSEEYGNSQSLIYSKSKNGDTDRTRIHLLASEDASYKDNFYRDELLVSRVSTLRPTTGSTEYGRVSSDGGAFKSHIEFQVGEQQSELGNVLESSFDSLVDYRGYIRDEKNPSDRKSPLTIYTPTRAEREVLHQLVTSAEKKSERKSAQKDTQKTVMTFPSVDTCIYDEDIYEDDFA